MKSTNSTGTSVPTADRRCQVLLKSRRLYVGRGHIEGNWLHFDGGLKLASLNRPFADHGAKSWSVSAVAQVRWLADEPEKSDVEL